MSASNTTSAFTGSPTDPPALLQANNAHHGDSFTYPSLALPNSIRMLKLRGTPFQESPLDCQLLEISLDKPPKYEAISYSWDGQSPSCEIICNERKLLVTKNCVAALQRFRPKSPLKHRLLWIDGICINQHSTEEKNQQVRLMPDVYRSASCVLVWLGSPPSAKSWEADAFRLLKQAGELAQKRRSTTNDEKLARMSRLEKLTDIQFVLAKISWFKRLWPVQEYILARNAVLIYGTEKINKTHIRELIIRVRHLLNDGFQGLVTMDAALSTLHAYSYVTYCVENKETAKFFSRLRWFSTKYPSDKVFAVQGLLQATGVLLPDPDYTKPYTTVYREAYMALIQHNRRLTSLTLCSMISSIPNLPSWVPNLSIIEYPHTPSTSPFKATQQTSFQFSEDGFRLEVLGVQLDKVAVVAGKHLIEPEYKDASNFAQFDSEMIMEGLTTGGTHGNLARILWNIRALAVFVQFAEREFSGLGKDEALKKLCHCQQGVATALTWTNSVDNTFPAFREWARRVTASSIPAATDDEVSQLSAETSTSIYLSCLKLIRDPRMAYLTSTEDFQRFRWLCQEPTVIQLHEKYDSYLRHMTIFKTENGRLGICQYPVEPLDAIVYFPGEDTPFVLRRDGQHFKLVSPAFVGGLAEDFDEGMISYTEFSII